MLEAIGSIFGSGALGGLFGMVGSYLQKKEERKLISEQNEHNLKMAKIDLQESKLDRLHTLQLADKQIEETQVEGEIAQDVSDSNAFGESLKAHAKSTGILFVDAVKALMRPLITVYLIIVTTILYFSLSKVINGIEGLDVVVVTGLYKAIINDILFLTVTSVTWWFGSRTKNRK